MDKKTSIVIVVIGVIIIALIGLAFGLESNTEQLTSEDIMRINGEIYKKEDFEKYLKYTLYKNGGQVVIDEEEHAEDLANGTSREDIFLQDTLNNFYQLKVFGFVGKDKNVTLADEDVESIKNDFSANKEKILASGLTEEDFISIAKEEKIKDNISYSPSEYLELPDGVFDEYVEQFSGDDAKSYTYRIMQVNYTDDTVSGEVSGESSGEVVPGNKAEKEAYMNELVARINAGESFVDVAKSGDSRLIYVGNGIQFANDMQEHSAGFFLEQKMGEKLYEAAKNTKVGNITEVVDNEDSFQIALIENIEEGIVGEAKDELIELLISNYASDLVYSYVKDMEVNNSAVSRIKVK